MAPPAGKPRRPKGGAKPKPAAQAKPAAKAKPGAKARPTAKAKPAVERTARAPRDEAAARTEMSQADREAEARRAAIRAERAAKRPPKPRAPRPATVKVPDGALRVVVLAAGSGKRMHGAPVGGKLATEIDGRTVLEWTLQLLAQQAEELGEKLHAWVVLKPESPLAATVAAFKGGRWMTQQPVTATNARRGMAWSLRAGLDAALGTKDEPIAGVHGAFVLPADDPLAALDLALVARTANRESDRPALVERAGSGAPHPVWIPVDNARRFVPPEKGPGADRGLRGLLHKPVAVTSSGPTPVDLDQPKDVAPLRDALGALGSTQ